MHRFAAQGPLFTFLALAGMCVIGRQHRLGRLKAVP
jgi:hypothetical protein